MPDRPGEPPRDLARDAAWIAAAFACAILVYASALTVPFESDDLLLIVNNEHLRSGRWRDVLLTGLWASIVENAPYYRPLPAALFKASVQLFGVRPEPIHAVSVLLHAGASALVFLLARRVVPVAAAGAAAVLFAVHPIHAEAVSWASGIMDVASAFFTLLAVVLHLRGARTSRGVAAIAFLLGLLCKETAVVAPVLVVGHAWLFRRRVSPRELAPMAVAAAGYLALRLVALHGVAGPPLLPLGAAATNVLSAIWYYASHGIVPVPLNFAPTLPRHAPWLASLLAAAVVAAGALVARAGRAQAFAVLVLLAPILPTLYVAATTGSAEKVVAERYLYLPSVGVVMLWGTLLASIGRRAWLRDALGIGAVALGAALTLGRNAAWHDPVALWTDAVAQSPDQAAAHEGRGFALLRAGRQEEGRSELALAGRLDPAMRARYLASARAARARGQFLQAVVTLQTAVLLDPSDPEARLELVDVYRERGWFRPAADEYRALIASEGDTPEARNNLGILLARAGDYRAALVEFEHALRLQPGNEEIRRNAARARELAEEQRPGAEAEMPRGHPPLGR